MLFHSRLPVGQDQGQKNYETIRVENSVVVDARQAVDKEQGLEEAHEHKP